MTRAALGAAITAALIALVAAPAALAYDSYRIINEVASWLAMRPVKVHCLTPEESRNDPIIVVYGAEAYVAGTRDIQGHWHPGKTAVFKHGYCETILAVQRGDASGYTPRDIALAALILTHEAGHLRGHFWSGNEAKTECWAIRHVGYVLARLGVESTDARRMLVSEAVAVHKSLPAEYQLGTCVVPK